MPQYTLTVHIEKKVLSKLVKDKYFLCMAHAVKGPSGEPDYNVVALAAEVSKTNTIKFTNKYSMFGTKQTFKEGDTTSTGDADVLPIEFGEGYLIKDWSDATVVKTPKAPPAGFAFMNSMEAAAVVSLEKGPAGAGSKDESNAPIYISSQFIPGFAQLTPITNCVVWFQQNVTTRTMVSVDRSISYVFKLTGRTEASVTYTDTFKWQEPTLTPDAKFEPIENKKTEALPAEAAPELAGAKN